MRNTIHYIVCIFLIIIICLCTFSCRRLPGSTLRIGVIVPTMNEEQYVLMKQGIEELPDTLRAKLIWTVADNSEERQAFLVDSLLDKAEIDGLVFAPINDRVKREVMKKIEEVDIPVVAINEIPLSANVFVFVTPNNFFAGKQ